MSNAIHVSKTEPCCGRISVEQAVDYVLNCLPSDEEQDLDAHLDVCEECAARILDLMQASEAWCGEEGEQRLADFGLKLFQAANEAYLAIAQSREVRERPRVDRTAPDRRVQEIKEERMFALGQLTFEKKEKELLANWTRSRFPVEGGDSVYFDAGSTAYEAFRALRDHVAVDPRTYITAVTHNFTILKDWATHELTNELLGQGTRVRSVGNDLDPVHQALFGGDISETLTGGDFGPSLIVVGASGIEVDGGRIWFAYHAGGHERAVKQALFRARCEYRVILATAKKIGRARGDRFDLLAPETELDTAAPLFLATTEPKTENEKKLYDDMMRAVNTDVFQNAIAARKLDFRWVEVRENGSSYVIHGGLEQTQEANHD